MGNFAVIDTETTWSDKLMSVGIIITDDKTHKAIRGKYYLIEPTYREPSMYEGSLFLRGLPDTMKGKRPEVMRDINNFLKENCVSRILAYNATFDKKHMPELAEFEWRDIMLLAGYRQFNKKIPSCAECCKSGRLKKGYGVEPMLRLLSGDYCYEETHNAYFDARDELRIVQLLGYTLEVYDEHASIK